MCVGFPGVVVAVDTSGVTVETEGRRRRASMLLLPDLRVGDAVIVAAGTVIERLDPLEAAAISHTLRTAIAELTTDD